MTNDEKPKIRKVWLPTEMKAAVIDYCWRKRTKPSPYIVSVIERIVADAGQFAGAAIPPAGLDYSSVYIQDALWQEGKDVAAGMRTQLSALVRVAIAADLAEEGIPWDVTTTRPKNDHIPIQE